MKPLVLVNGKPLIQHALDHAAQSWHADVKIVVAAPSNASLLVQITAGGVDHWVLQPNPQGVVDAIERAIPLVETEWTLILCSDNTFSQVATLKPHRACFGARQLDTPAQASRFTRYVSRPGGGVLLHDAYSTHECRGVWIGPLLLKTQAIRNNRGLTSIVALMRQCTENGKYLWPIEMQCEDLGIPEVL